MLHHTTTATLCGTASKLAVLKSPVKISPCRLNASRATASSASPRGEGWGTDCGDKLSRRPVLSLLGMTAVAEMVDVEQMSAHAADEEKTSSSRNVFLDISVDRKPYGRIVVQLFDDVPIGSQRFADLAVGKEGVGYRLSKFDSLRENYISNEGVARLSYKDTGDSPIAGGDSLEELLAELETVQHLNDASGLVSLVVKSNVERQSKSRLVAVQGKLVTVEDELGATPNGTAFAITTAPCPDLNTTNLVIGKVVDGMDVVQSLQGLPTVKENNSSPFFQAAKAFGDKRADVAERGFGKPFNRLVVMKGGQP